MVQESLYVDGEEITSIRAAAKEHHITVSLGISEKVRYSSATLFNTNLIIGADGEIKVHHRKLVATFFEKLTWSPGDGHGLQVVDVEGKAKVGALICGENTNPLARYALMAQGEQVHISTWPAIWPTREGGPTKTGAAGSKGENGTGTGELGTGDVKVERNYDNVAANRIRAAAHCFEAKCFGVLCASHLNDEAINVLSSGVQNPEAVEAILRSSSQGATMFLDPTGAALPGFVIDSKTGKEAPKEFLQHEEGILYADLDIVDCVEGKQYHDVVGGYQRLDVFDLKVDRRRREPVIFVDDAVKER